MRKETGMNYTIDQNPKRWTFVDGKWVEFDPRDDKNRAVNPHWFTPIAECHPQAQDDS